MRCNVRWAVRDFALNSLLLQDILNFVLGLGATDKYMTPFVALKKN
jgi:hypothetical protein